jgi:hypothetical protein
MIVSIPIMLNLLHMFFRAFWELFHGKSHASEFEDFLRLQFDRIMLFCRCGSGVLV